MAPVTRARRIHANITGESIEPISPALTSNTITPTRLSHNHVRFDRDEENTPATADPKMRELTEGEDCLKEGTMDGTDWAKDEVPEAEDSDNDAPEAVSMSAGKEEAERREEEARRAVEAYISPQFTLV